MNIIEALRKLRDDLKTWATNNFKNVLTKQKETEDKVANIVEDETAALQFTDPEGNVIAQIDESGISTVGVKVNGKDVALQEDLEAIDLLDTSITLSETIWTDKTIGYINGTSTKPVVVGEAGDSLKDVFTNIFGTVEDDSSNLVTNPYIKNISIGDNYYEYGTKLNSVSVTITPESGSYKYGPTVSGAGWNGNYILSGTGFTTKNDSTNNTQTVNLSSTFTVGTSLAVILKVTRNYDAATNTAKSKMGATTEQKIVAGTAEKEVTFNPTAKKYVYWAKSTSSSTPTTWTLYGTGQTSVTDLQLSCAAGEYLWVAATDNCTSFYAWNDASGKYNTDKLATTKTGTTSITNSQGTATPGYYIYRTTNTMSSAVNTKFKLV